MQSVYKSVRLLLCANTNHNGPFSFPADLKSSCPKKEKEISNTHVMVMVIDSCNLSTKSIFILYCSKFTIGLK
jgi:hypothetical protein